MVADNNAGLAYVSARLRLKFKLQVTSTSALRMFIRQKNVLTLETQDSTVIEQL